MSHFTCLVVGDNPEEQLAPFQENNNGDCPSEYMTFQDNEDEWLDEYNKGTCKEFYCSSSCSWGQTVSKENFAAISKAKVGVPFVMEILKVNGGGVGYFKKDAYYRCGVSENHETPKKQIWVKVNKILTTTHPDKEVCFDGTIEVVRVKPPKNVKFKSLYKTFEEFCDKWHGHSERDEKEGRYGYWANPNAKWDWFQIGGRWAGFFKLKPGCRGEMGERSWANESAEIPSDMVDQAKKGDIDWDGMKARNLENLDKYWKEAEGQDDTSRYFRFGIEKGMTKDEFLAKGILPTTFAVLKDGKWYEKGEMGWWACVSNEKNPGEWEAEFTKLLESLSDDTLLTVVDCHI